MNPAIVLRQRIRLDGTRYIAAEVPEGFVVPPGAELWLDRLSDASFVLRVVEPSKPTVRALTATTKSRPSHD